MKKASLAAALAAFVWSGSGHAQDLTYLRNLLAVTPTGGWVQANTNKWSDVWPTGSVGIPATGFGATQNVVNAWSSMAWDSARGNLLLWGGGHASYQGNEMYVWQGATGQWTRGSLASNIMPFPASPDPRTRLVVDDLAPQSAHTYAGNQYLPVNDMFVTFGGNVFNDAGLFEVRDTNGNMISAGPWLWDPTKANPNQVGGSSGSGYDPTTPGGNMWINRGAQWKTQVPSLMHFVDVMSATRVENNQDVVYLTYLNGGWPLLYRYMPGDVRGGNAVDQWKLVGTTSYVAAAIDGAATIDSRHNLFIATADHPSTVPAYALNVWDLGKQGSTNASKAVTLVNTNGSLFTMTGVYGIAYDSATDQIYLYSGSSGGTIYRTRAVFNSNGSLANRWVVQQLTSTTPAQPTGGHPYGVYGKFKYVPALDAFIALDSWVGSKMDAGVWLYKPVPAALPVPATQVSTMSTGLVYSRVSQTFNGTVTIKNIQGTAIDGPLHVLFSGVPTNVTVANASGSFLGTPYLTIPGIASLAPGQSASVTVKLSNPSNGALAITPAVYVGAFN